MGWYTWPKPGAKNDYTGEEIGPCVDENCGHKDCARTRANAAAPCRICRKEIGYEVPFYFEQDGQFVHARCFWRTAEEEAKKARKAGAGGQEDEL